MKRKTLVIPWDNVTPMMLPVLSTETAKKRPMKKTNAMSSKFSQPMWRAAKTAVTPIIPVFWPRFLTAFF